MCDDLCPDGPPESYEVKPFHEAWHDYVVEGVAPSYAVAARTCNAYLKALHESEPITRHLRFVFHVEPYDAEA